MALADNQSLNPPPVRPNYLCQNIYRLHTALKQQRVPDPR